MTLHLLIFNRRSFSQHILLISDLGEYNHRVNLKKKFENISVMLLTKMLNNNGSKTEPRGTPDRICIFHLIFHL